MQRAFKTSIAVSALLLLGSLSSCESQDLSPTKSQAPVPNPHPTKVVRVHGTIDPSLSLEISTQYMSSAPRCSRTINWLEGVSDPISVWSESVVQRSDDQYEASVIIDRYQEGSCGWYPSAIGFYVTNRNGAATFHSEWKQGSAHEGAGPQQLVWIHTLGKGGSLEVDVRTGGVARLVPFEVGCVELVSTGLTRLNCYSPRGIPAISEDATEVHVDLRDLTSYGPPADRR